MGLLKATIWDLEAAAELYRGVAAQAEKEGLNPGELFPGEDGLRADIEAGRLFLRMLNGRPAAGAILETEPRPDAGGISWSCGTRWGTLSRLAVDPSLWEQGFGSEMMDEVIRLLRAKGCDSLRCEVRENNVRMLGLLEQRTGFRRCGIRPAKEGARICLDKALRRETPILPIRMTPAFRGGSLTPWGGERLRTVYGKQLKEIPTGESLEVSCIPGLESRDHMGRTLPELIAEYGRKLVGKYDGRPFPLLLKLIDARESLSVQVHPDNEYAQAHENGKLGKTEAWLILDTPRAGGELVYGIAEGTSLRKLKSACMAGSEVEPLLRRVRVRAGDVCYIPAGCVHAIGAGILLYEIQESSDITYRFYDWDRRDSRGNRRQLHLEQALAVTNLELAPKPIHVEWAPGVKRVLNEEFFTLDILRPSGPLKLPAVREFGFLTVLEGALTLRWQSGSMKLNKGETCFLPSMSPEGLQLEGSGSAALSMPD